MTAPAVRDARVEDCDAIVAMVAAYKTEQGKSSEAAAVRGAAMACIDLPEHDLLVADAGGEVVGYLAVHWIPFPLIHGCEGYISDLVVRRDWRGRGIGTLLVAAVEARAKASGGARLMLHTRTSGEAFDWGFFKKTGFRPREDFASFTKIVD